MAKKPEPWIVPIKAGAEKPDWGYESDWGYEFGVWATCPDCGRRAFLPGEEHWGAEEYDFCPYCGRKRYAEESYAEGT